MSAQECINALRQGKLAPLLQWVQELPNKQEYAFINNVIDAETLNILIALNLANTDFNQDDLPLIQRLSVLELGIAEEASSSMAFFMACAMLFRMPLQMRKAISSQFPAIKQIKDRDQQLIKFEQLQQQLQTLTTKSAIEDRMLIPIYDDFFAIGLAELEHSKQVKQEQVERLKQLLGDYQNHLIRLLAQDNLSSIDVELPAYGLQTKINIPSHWQVRHQKLAARYNAVVDCSNTIIGSQSITPEVKHQVRNLVTQCNNLQPSFSEKAFLDQLLEIVSKFLIFGFFVKTQEQRHQQQLTQACNPA